MESRNANITRLLLFTLGVTAMSTQVIMIRETLAVFQGNELIIGLFLGIWMLLTAAGAMLAVQSSKYKVQINPNPTRGNIDFRFSILDSRYVSLRIYDALGREVAVVLDGWCSGDQVVRWNMTGLPAGIYIYRLTTDDRRLTTETGKIVKY